MKDRVDVDLNDYYDLLRREEKKIRDNCIEWCIDCGIRADCSWYGDFFPDLEGDYRDSEICDVCSECDIKHICICEQDENGKYIIKEK